jgi:hypothetical protein
MNNDYLKMAVKKELEIGELKEELKQQNKTFGTMIGFFCLLFVITGTLFLVIQYDIGYHNGIKEGKVKSINSCINYFCEEGNCLGWDDLPIIAIKCQNIITHKGNLEWRK